MRTPSPDHFAVGRRAVGAGRLSSWLARWLCGLSCFVLSAQAGPLLEETATKLENQVKAAFMIKFAAFIEWPEPDGSQTNAPFVIGILGKDPFGNDFDDAVRSERVKGRRVELRRASKPEELQDCQVVFVADSEQAHLAEILQVYRERPVLVITDEPGAVQRGSMINFFKEHGKVRFEFNLTTAERAGLKFSAKLLQVGKITVPPPADERSRP